MAQEPLIVTEQDDGGDAQHLQNAVAPQVGNLLSDRAAGGIVQPPPRPKPGQAPEDIQFDIEEVGEDFEPLGGQQRQTQQQTAPQQQQPDPQDQDRGGQQQQEARPGDEDLGPDGQPRNRRQRHARQREGRERTIERNRYLETEVETLRQRLETLEPRVADIDHGRVTQRLTDIDRELQDAQRVQEQAYTKMTEAMASADSASFTAAMRQRDEAMVKATQLQARRTFLAAPGGAAQPADPRFAGGGQIQVAPQYDPRYVQPPQQQFQRDPAPPLPTEVRRRVADFQDQHDWYDGNSAQPRDMDSQIVRQIDAHVASQRFNPGSDAYWDEVESMMRQYLPHRFQDDGAQPVNGNGHQQASRQQPAQTARRQPAQQRPAAPQLRGPQVGGQSDRAPPSNGGRGQKVYLTPGRKDALIQIGALARDGRTVVDTDRFNRQMKAFAAYDKENGVPGRLNGG